MEILGTDTEAVEKARSFLDEWHSAAATVVARTSGSTGAPKSINLSKSDMLVSAKATNAFFGIERGDLLYMPLSTDYIAGKMMVVRAVCADADVYAERPSNHLLPPESSRRIKLACIVPSQIDTVLSMLWRERMESVIIGGAPISPICESRLEQLGMNAYATYGMTETCSHIALRKLGDSRYHTLPHVTVTTDDRGCLVAKSDMMSFKELVTNDIVKLIDDRTFQWLGRFDNVINSGGIKIHPEIIERRIAPLFKDSDYFISSMPSPKWGSEVVLVVESPTPMPDLYDDLAQLLSSKEMPKRILFAPHFERTSSGKTNRNATMNVIIYDDNAARPNFIELNRRIFKKKA